jgi:hypothetical protein
VTDFQQDVKKKNKRAIGHIAHLSNLGMAEIPTSKQYPNTSRSYKLAE